MARQRATLSTLPTALIEALHDALTLKPADDSQRIAQPEMVKATPYGAGCEAPAHCCQPIYSRQG